ncbi:MAG: cytochrome c [Planctomycetaceae bacterium]
MHDMMEVINGRSSQLRRDVKRLKEPEEAKLHAVAIAVLSVVMKADTHEVKNEAEIPEWEQIADESQSLAVKLAAAISAGEKDEAQDVFKNLGTTCKSCHTKFRHEE